MTRLRRSKLKALRLSSGLSLRATGKLLGMTKGSYGNIEGGFNDPSFPTTIKLLALFSCDFSDLLPDEPLPTDPSPDTLSES